MTILGGTGTLLGPVLGAGIIKGAEAKLSQYNDSILTGFYDFLPETLQHAMVSISGLFVGEGWHLTLGAAFMLVVIFLPGGVMEGVRRIGRLFSKRKRGSGDAASQPAE